MVIFLDTNIILDVLLERKPFFEDSLTVLNTCETREHEGWLSLFEYC